MSLHLAKPVAPPAGFDLVGTVLHGAVEEIAEELPRLLRRVAASGGQVLDVEVQAPTLQAVFLHLTGRELRE